MLEYIQSLIASATKIAWEEVKYYLRKILQYFMSRSCGEEI